MLRRPVPHEPTCSSYLSVKSLSPSTQQTSVDYSCSSSGESVVNHFDTILFEYTRMSLMNNEMNLLNFSMNMEFMRYVKCAGALVNLNDITRYT
jgi:hypothetical protein